jgi:sensor histidine kinase YesM
MYMTKTEKYLPFILAFGFPAISFINNNVGLPEVALVSIIGSYTALMLFLLLIWYFNQYIFRRLPPGKKKPLIIAVLNVVVIVAFVPVIQIVVQENIGTAVRIGLWTTVLRMGMAAAIITMIQHALRVSKQRQVLQLEKSVLESEKLKAELNAMKQQINPHFLFNSLNTLIDLIEDNQEKAVEFVRSFSNLYRIVLQSTRHNLIPLKDELTFLNYCWELLKMRFNDTVQLNIVLPDEMLDYHIPPLSLQLLVENAVKHNQFSRNQPLVVIEKC